MALRKPLVQNGGSYEELPTTDTLNVDAAAVFNETGDDVDFRIESIDEPFMFWVDAGANRVRMGPNGAEYFSVQSSIVNVNANSNDIDFQVRGNGNQFLFLIDGGAHTVGIGTNTGTYGDLAFFQSGGIVFNERGADQDFRVEGDTNSQLFVVDAGQEAVQVGTTAAGEIADFRSNSVVLNEVGADRDFRVEGDTLTHMIFCDASAATENIALLATAAPNWQSMDRGVFVGDASTAPTGNPSSGVFVWSESAKLKVRDGSGVVTTLGAPSPRIDLFTTSGTWTKPSGAVTVDVYLVGSGGGGGTGRRGAAGTTRAGGGGGGGGGSAYQRFAAGDLSSTEAVTLGTAGAGGSDVTTDDTNGAAGGSGGSTTFGAHLSASGGNGGSGGTTSSGTGGAGGSAGTGGQAGGTGGNGADSSAATNGAAITGVRMAGGGGGGGGAINGSNVVVSSATGGNSGGSFGQRGVEQKINFGGTAKTIPAVGATGYPGPTIVTPSTVAACGGGGGGGASATESSDASDSYIIQGGAGGRFGAGGGGAPGRTNGVPGFFGGGFGGPGLAIAVTYFSAEQLGTGSGV